MDSEGPVTVNRASEDDRRVASQGRRLSDILRSVCVVADIGFQRAGRGLTEMTGVPTEAKAAQVRKVSLTKVPDLVGGPGAVVTGIYLMISGNVDGHMLLMLPLEDACRLAAMILEEPTDPNNELSEMARSALAEVGNITGASFLAALADASSLELSPSPPTVMVDMSGAVLDTVLAQLGMESEEVFVIDTVFTQHEQQVNAVFLVLPRQQHFDVIVESLPK